MKSTSSNLGILKLVTKSKSPGLERMTLSRWVSPKTAVIYPPKAPSTFQFVEPRISILLLIQLYLSEELKSDAVKDQ